MASIVFELSSEDVRQLLWEGLLARGFKPAKHVRDIDLRLEVNDRGRAELRGGSVALAIEPLDDRLLPPEWARKRSPKWT